MLPQLIPGHTSVQEGDWLRAMARAKTVLEIGAFRGRSTAYLASSAASLLTCDHFCGQKKLRLGQRIVDMRKVERDWRDTVALLGIQHKVTLFRMSSHDCYNILQAEGVRGLGLVFVDGGHDDATVERDTRFAEMLCVQGVIAFHDYHSARFPTIKDVVDAWYRRNARGYACIPSAGSIRAFQRNSESHRSEASPD